MNDFISYEEQLEKFEEAALKVIKENGTDIKDYVRTLQERYAIIQPILDSEEFNRDLDTYVSIQKKYEEEGIDIPELLGYFSTRGIIGAIVLNGKYIDIDEEIFPCEEGITLIMKILDLLDVDFNCKYCAVRPMCRKLNPDMDCKKVQDIMEGDFLMPFVHDIISKICEFSQEFSQSQAV
jgi:hypothetical protein